MVWDLSRPARYDVVEWVLGGWGSPSSPEVHEHKGQPALSKIYSLASAICSKRIVTMREGGRMAQLAKKATSKWGPRPVSLTLCLTSRGGEVTFTLPSIPQAWPANLAKWFRWQHKVTLAEWSFWEACQQTSLYQLSDSWAYLSMEPFLSMCSTKWLKFRAIWKTGPQFSFFLNFLAHANRSFK